MGGVDAVEEEIGAGVVLLGGEDAAGHEEREAADRVAVGGDGGRCELPERRREDGAVVEDVDEAAVGKEGKEARGPCQEAGEVGDEAGEAVNGDGRLVEGEVDVRVEREEARREEGGGVAREAWGLADDGEGVCDVVEFGVERRHVEHRRGGWCGGGRRTAKKS